MCTSTSPPTVVSVFCAVRLDGADTCGCDGPRGRRERVGVTRRKRGACRQGEQMNGMHSVVIATSERRQSTSMFPPLLSSTLALLPSTWLSMCMDMKISPFRPRCYYHRALLLGALSVSLCLPRHMCVLNLKHELTVLNISYTAHPVHM